LRHVLASFVCFFFSFFHKKGRRRRRRRKKRGGGREEEELLAANLYKKGTRSQYSMSIYAIEVCFQTRMTKRAFLNQTDPL